MGHFMSHRKMVLAYQIFIKPLLNWFFFFPSNRVSCPTFLRWQNYSIFRKTRKWVHQGEGKPTKGWMKKERKKKNPLNNHQPASTLTPSSDRVVNYVMPPPQPTTINDRDDAIPPPQPRAKGRRRTDHREPGTKHAKNTNTQIQTILRRWPRLPLSKTSQPANPFNQQPLEATTPLHPKPKPNSGGDQDLLRWNTT